MGNKGRRNQYWLAKKDVYRILGSVDLLVVLELNRAIILAVESELVKEALLGGRGRVGVPVHKIALAINVGVDGAWEYGSARR